MINKLTIQKNKEKIFINFSNNNIIIHDTLVCSSPNGCLSQPEDFYQFVSVDLS